MEDSVKKLARACTAVRSALRKLALDELAPEDVWRARDRAYRAARYVKGGAELVEAAVAGYGAAAEAGRALRAQRREAETSRLTEEVKAARRAQDELTGWLRR
jgi:hypothetical protein